MTVASSSSTFALLVLGLVCLCCPTRAFSLSHRSNDIQNEALLVRQASTIVGKHPHEDITSPSNRSNIKDEEEDTATTTPTTATTTTTSSSSSIKHPKPLSFLVSLRFLLASYRGKSHRYLYHLMKKHGDCFIIDNKYVVIHDTAMIRDVLETHNLEKTLPIRLGYRYLFGGNSILAAAPYPRWLTQRRMTAPAVLPSVIRRRRLTSKLARGVQPVLDLLENAALSLHRDNNNGVVEMDQVFTSVALDLIGLVLLSRSFGVVERLLLEYNNKKNNNKQQEEGVPFSRALNILTKETVRRMTLPSRVMRWFPPGRKVKEAREIVNDFLEDCVRQRIQERATLDDSSNIAADMIDILLDAEQEGLITKADVKSQLLTFIFAGHDTTAHTLSWLLYEVSQNDDLQRALYEEARATVLPNRNDFVSCPDIVHDQLPLLDCVWKEANRKHPAAATGMVRQVGKSKIVVGDGVELPARATVLIPSFSLHRNEKYWKDPETFNPYRFLEPDNGDDIDPMAFQAFSSGPRNCIGGRLARAEALCLLAPIFRRFKVTCLEKREPDDICRLTRRPRNGIRFRFVARPT